MTAHSTSLHTRANLLVSQEIGRAANAEAALSASPTEPVPVSSLSGDDQPRGVADEVWGLAHNDWWNRYGSNYGQWFVAIPREHSAAYDSQWGEHVCWLPKSIVDARMAPERHMVLVDQAEERARAISATPAMLKALLQLEPYLDAIVCYASSMDEHEPNRIAHDARQAIKKALGK